MGSGPVVDGPVRSSPQGGGDDVSTLIKGGRIITAADDYVGDVYVEGERISMLGESLDVDADRVIDASGKYVLPGCVDPHTHLDMPFGGTVTIDDVTSGQTAAAFGGTTCHVDFCIQTPGSSFAEALDSWHAKREGKQIIDMGYHIAVTDLREGGSLEELARLPEQGITSYKLFMAYKGALMVDDETLFRTMEVAAETGALVMVHAENGDAIDVLVKQALAAGNTAPHYHALTRPPETEGEATNRAIQLARVAGAPLYVVHVSCKESVDPIARARELGWDVWGETCTQYFFIDYTYLERPDFEGAKYVYTPPPRAIENQDVLWHARALGHPLGDLDRPLRVPVGRSEVARPRRLLEDPERRPGAREPAAHDPRVRCSRRPHLTQPHGRAARDEPGEALRPVPAEGNDRARLRRRHRHLRPGAPHLITAATQHSKTDYNLYEGTEVTGSPETVLLRGNVLVEGGELVAEPGVGEFVERAAFGQELLPAASSLTNRCAEARRTRSPLSGAPLRTSTARRLASRTPACSRS